MAGNDGKKRRPETGDRRPKKRAPKKRASKQPAPKKPATRRPVSRLPSPVSGILARLKSAYPDARCSLDFENPLQLLVATILSAQCTDARVNMVTKVLFAKYRTAADYANANPEVFSQEIRSTGFFNNKTKNVLGMANALIERHDGRVPDTMADLVPLPGVGRKTANVVLGNAFGKNEGVVVDTHVGRISQLLGLTRQTDPVKIEQDLIALIPRKEWTLFPHLMIHHGRAVCIAGRPQCQACVLSDLCPASSV